MAEKTSEKKAVLNDRLTECQKNLMMHIICKRAPGVIDLYIGKPLDKTSEFDIDDAVCELGEPATQMLAELKGYLFAVYDSRRDPPEDESTSPHLHGIQQVLIAQFHRREPKFSRRYFGKPLNEITKADVADARRRIEKDMEATGYWSGLGILRGYLQAVEDANVKVKEILGKKTAVRGKAKRSVPTGLMDTGLEESKADFALNDSTTDDMEWPDDRIHPYEKDGRSSVYEIGPANRTLIVEGEESGKGLTDLKELQVEHLHSILNAIRKEPAKYIDLKTGEFVSRKLAKLTVAVLNDIRAIDPDFNEGIDIPGYKAIRSAELYKSAKRCLKKASKGR